jgi:hypothetical protein
MEPVVESLPMNQHVNLIPLGRLGILPFHAAWTEDAAMITGKMYAIDHISIAYAPNARLLLHARKIAETLIPDSQFAVDGPGPVESGNLQFSGIEVRAVASMFNQERYRIVRHEAATRETVMQTILNHTVFTFPVMDSWYFLNH